MIGLLGSALSLPLQSPVGFSMTQQVQQAHGYPDMPLSIFVGETHIPNGSGSLAARDRITKIRQLKDGWNGPGSVRIDETIIGRVTQALGLILRVKSLPDPEITPTSNGTISLEWEGDQISIYIEIGKTRMNGFMQGKLTGLAIIPDTGEIPLEFFEGLSEIINPSASTTITQYSAQNSFEEATAA